MDSQALALNNVILQENPAIHSMLSHRGKHIFFPKLGILAQAAQAKSKEINATIGEAIADNGKHMYLPEFESYITLPVEQVFPYTPSYGKPELRATWKEFMYKKNPSLKNIAISNPIATNGLTHAISMAAYMFANENDTVIIPDLYWENYDLIFNKSYGATIKTFNTFDNKSFDVKSLERAIELVDSNKILLLLNFPNNPTGYTPTEAEVEAITAVILKSAEAGKHIVVIIDDAYFGLVYENGIFEESIFTKLCSLHERVLTVKLDGPTKEDYVWGFRVGFLTYGVKNASAALYESLEAKTAGAVRGNISNISNISQSLLQNVYQSAAYSDMKKEKYAILKSRYNALKRALDAKGYIYYKALPFNSGYFMCIRLEASIEGEKLRQLLLEKYSTGVIVFGDIVRLAYSAVPEQKIEALVNNIFAACQELSK